MPGMQEAIFWAQVRQGERASLESLEQAVRQAAEAKAQQYVDEQRQQMQAALLQSQHEAQARVAAADGLAAR